MQNKVILIITFLSTSLLLGRGTILGSNLTFSLFAFSIQLVSIVLYTFVIITKLKMTKIMVFISLLSFYIISSIPAFYLNNPGSSIIIPLMGFANLLLSLLFWFSLNEYMKSETQFMIKLVEKQFVIFGSIITIISLVQFIVSPTVFGLLRDSIFTIGLENVTITKRAISLIGSPQSLAIYIGLSSTVVLHTNIITNRVKIPIFGLMILTGFLTFSKSFIVFWFVYGLLLLKQRVSLKRLTQIGLSAIIITLIVIYFSDLDGVNRIADIGGIISNLTEYGTFTIWIQYLSTDVSLFRFLFGEGLGLMSRGAEMYTQSKIFNGSTESYILQVYYELGFVGLLLFMMIIITAIKNYSKDIEYRHYGHILMALLTNLIVSPAFYGFTISYFAYSVIIPGLFVNRLRKGVRIQNNDEM